MSDASRRPQVVIGLLGTALDAGTRVRRWDRWRPTISLVQHEDYLVDRLELLHDRRGQKLAEFVAEDIHHLSPETEVRLHLVHMSRPWDFELVYGALHDFARSYDFQPDEEDYLVHITTGTHVAQICCFLLTEAREFPARLVQTGPPRAKGDGTPSLDIIDLDLSRYDRLATRFAEESRDAVASLKGGIETRNEAFNALIARIEFVAGRTTDPILLTGPTGAGKTRLASRIHQLRAARKLVSGPLIQVNCATLRGDTAMATLFGHAKGAFTGATSSRPGLLRAADGGTLFLDEIGELGPDEQAMLLRAIEEGRFLPLGADTEATSDFQLLAGTNRDLPQDVASGRFREDLLARINLWSFRLPPLIERREDIEPNLDFELDRLAEKHGKRTRFNAEARAHFLAFATSPAATWPGNFRDLSAALTRMATLAPAGRITLAITEEEITRLSQAASATSTREALALSTPQPPSPSSAAPAPGPHAAHPPQLAPTPTTAPPAPTNPHPPNAQPTDAELLNRVLPEEAQAKLDLLERVQVLAALRACHDSKSLAEAGRRLFAISRQARTNPNDSDRIRKLLKRFGIDPHDAIRPIESGST